MKPEDLLLAPELTSEQVNEFLSRYGFQDPAAADRNLQLMAESLATREMLARIIKNLLEVAQQSPDPDAAFNNFERVLGAVTHQANFLGFLGDTPEALEAIILICGTSPYSSEILIRNPEYFYWLLDQLGSTWIKSREAYLKEARQASSKFERPTEQLHALARFKRREMLRIGARDILKVTDLAGSVAELSNLADVVIELAYEICYARLVERYGTPQYQDGRGNSQTARFTVLGMGKLGGGELNYSSDIDLIYCYDGEQGATNNTSASLSNPEFFKKLAQSITQELSSSTEEGYFYRVDLRLRPEGSAGSVASSLTAYKNYYATWGETFERLALIKSRPVAGSFDLGREFCQAFNPFVYRKFLDFAAIEEIQEVKSRIDAKLGSKQKPESHVKLGPGGIREVEFFVQALQLIYGGRNPDLQERNTLKALDKLHSHDFLGTEEYTELREGYLFLRDLEHKLQMVLHFQTHELPSSQEELYKCARRMGYHGSSVADTVSQFLETYHRHTANVSRTFQNLIRLRREGGVSGALREASLVLNRNLAEEEAFAILSDYGFEDLKTAFHQIVLLRDTPSFSHSPSKMRNLLANLMPWLLHNLKSSPDADAGLSYFEKFTSALGERDSLYSLLNESSEVFSRLIRVLSSSPFLAEFLCHRPELFDSLIREESLPKHPNSRELRAKLEQSLSQTESYAARKMALRNFQKTELFRIGTRDILGQISRASVGKQLATLAEVCLSGAFGVACHELETQYGPGFCRWAKDHFAVLALGKLGGSDLSYNSDLDLIYFYSADDPTDSPKVQRRCVGLVETLDEILSVSRGEGSIYRIDTRLRPEGKKGELVVALHKYQEYLENRAEDWERLALVRHRFISGSRKIRSQLERLIERFVYQPAISRKTVDELSHIRQRMELELGKEVEEQRFHFKVGAGGLVDIEFATQLLQLKYGGRYPELRVPNTLLALKKLHALQLLEQQQFRHLYEGYEFLRLLENRLRITSPQGLTSFSRTPKSLCKMARLLGSVSAFPSGESFENAYLAKTQNIRSIFQEIISSLSNSQEVQQPEPRP